MRDISCIYDFIVYVLYVCWETIHPKSRCICPDVSTCCCVSYRNPWMRTNWKPLRMWLNWGELVRVSRIFLIREDMRWVEIQPPCLHSPCILPMLRRMMRWRRRHQWSIESISVESYCVCFSCMLASLSTPHSLSTWMPLWIYNSSQCVIYIYLTVILRRESDLIDVLTTTYLQSVTS